MIGIFKLQQTRRTTLVTVGDAGEEVGGKCEEMNGGEGWGRHRRLLFFASISLQLIPGSATDSSTPKDGGTASAVHSNSNSTTGIMALYISVGVAAVTLLAIFLWKLWKKKKREEEHARLLRLFEQDDELDLELGLRD